MNRLNIAQMFNKIAWIYDFLNHLFSLNIDKIWRKKAVKELRHLKLNNVLDVATGTADMALTIQKRLKPAHITGIDISECMLEIGRQKIEKKGLAQKISLKYCSSESLPFDDNSFDAVTVAFGIRNFENVDDSLCEMFRVLKNSGKLVIIELSVPKNRVFRTVYNLYFLHLIPLIGSFLSKDSNAYHYLPVSVQSFPNGKRFLQRMEKCGFSNVTIKMLSFGIACIYTGEKQ